MAVRFNEPRDKTFPLIGGLDQTTPHVLLKPGSIIAGKNIEIIGGRAGYSRLGGYERCTDDILPSTVTVSFFEIKNITGSIAIGDLFVSGDKSVRALIDIASPVNGDTTLPVATHDTDFVASSLFTGTGKSFDYVGLLADTSVYSNEELQAFKVQAIEQTRANIPEVSGSGLKLGGFRLRGSNYVFRGGTLYKGESYSWSTISMPDVLYFNEGISILSVGDIITDGTATGEITSVTTQEGVYDLELEPIDQGAGYVTLKDVVGTFTIGSDITIVGTNINPLVNGSFTTDTDWTKGTGWTIAAGSATSDGSQTDNSKLSQSYSASDGDFIQVEVITSGVTAGNVNIALGDDESVNINSNGTHIVTILLHEDQTEFAIVADVNFIGNIESVVTAVGVYAKVASVNETYVLPTTGRYETKNYNFTNLKDNDSTFGVCGTGDAFEYNGTDYIPIIYPDADSFPKHINIHQERLILAFDGGQRVYSVSGQPRVFNPILGAGTFSTGSEIVGFKTIHGNAEATFCEDSTWLLLGDGIYSIDSATRNWQFYEHDDDIGVIEWSVSGRGYPVYMSSTEIMMLTSTDTSSKYGSVDIAEEVQPYLDAHKGNVIASMWAKEKNQYRIFFENGDGLYIAFSRNKVAGITPVSIPNRLKNMWSSVENGIEYIYFISDDTEYLYRMDSGNTFDEEFLEGSFRVPFHHYGSPRIEKSFPQLIIELESPIPFSNTTVTYTANFDYGNKFSPNAAIGTETKVGGFGGFYGLSSSYGNFVYGGAVVEEIFAYIDGFGANMSILVSFKGKYDSAFNFLTMMVDFIELYRKGQN